MSFIKYKKLIFAWLFIISLIISTSVMADTTGPLNPWGDDTKKNQISDITGLGSASGERDPRAVAAQIINIALGFLGVIALGIILFAGFKWMTAGGNEDKVGEAKKWMVNGIIGLIIILAAFAIANFVLSQLIKATAG